MENILALLMEESSKKSKNYQFPLISWKKKVIKDSKLNMIYNLKFDFTCILRKKI